ncbi:MAG: DUF4097 family beta strand repeat-containing protein [Acidobacteriales bacterium]|nr:DUF4097 family beta strand repeat-containing protein [Terriglobales bacterium]
MTGKPKQMSGIIANVFAASLLCCSTLQAQSPPDRVAVPLTDPARPVRIEAGLVNGSITVKTHAAQNVIVEARARRGEEEASESGKKRLVFIPSTGLTVEEENNEVQVGADSHQRPVDLTILVPARTSVNLRTVNDGNILVSGINGEIDVDNVNGDVTLQDVSGYAVAHALNGELKANFRSIDPRKPMAFSSLNGDIEVTFPPDLKANISLDSERGEVYSDFDIQLQARAPQPVVEDARGQGGKYRVRVEKTIRGTINGGGQEIRFKNFNGSIYIRRSAAGATPPTAATPPTKPR